MSGVRNDFGCKRCGREDRNRVLPSGEAPLCCGGPMVTLWDHGQAPATDLHEPRYNHATGQYHRSTREAEMALAKMAGAWSAKTGMKWSPPKIAGDKVGGARYESAPSNAAFGYAGQAHRTSTGERPPLVDQGVPVKLKRRVPKNELSRYAVNGVAPQRMTRDQAERYKRSATHES